MDISFWFFWIIGIIAVVKGVCKIYDEIVIQKLKEVKEMNDSLDI